MMKYVNPDIKSIGSESIFRGQRRWSRQGSLSAVTVLGDKAFVLRQASPLTQRSAVRDLVQKSRAQVRIQ
jgi:hypothetical protein